MVRQAAGRADNDVGTAGEGLALVAHVHAADAGGEARTGRAVKPGQLAGDLHGQFARRRDDQGQRYLGAGQAVFLAQQVASHGEAEGNGLAGAGLGGDEQVAPGERRLDHGRLDLGEGFIALIGKGFGESRGNGRISGHVKAFGGWTVRDRHRGTIDLSEGFCGPMTRFCALHHGRAQAAKRP
jgi:hypothetical protein